MLPSRIACGLSVRKFNIQLHMEGLMFRSCSLIKGVQLFCKRNGDLCLMALSFIISDSLQPTPHVSGVGSCVIRLHFLSVLSLCQLDGFSEFISGYFVLTWVSRMIGCCTGAEDTSPFTHGFWFGKVLTFISCTTSSMHLHIYPNTNSVYSWMLTAASRKMSRSVVWKQSHSASSDCSVQRCIERITGFSRFRFCLFTLFRKSRWARLSAYSHFLFVYFPL